MDGIDCFEKIFSSQTKGYYQEYLIHLIILHLEFLKDFKF